MAEANKENASSEEPQSTEVENKSTEGKSVEELTAMNEKLYAETKGLRTEAKERRLKLEKFEKADKEKEEANLAATELVKVRDQEITDLKASAAQKELSEQFITLVRAKGFSEKVAKLGIPRDLTADNVLDSVKFFDKEYKDLKDPKATEETPNEAVSSIIQPGAPVAPPDNRTPEEKMGEYLNKQIQKGK